MSDQKCTIKEAELRVVLEELVREANGVSQFSQRNTELNAERFVQVLVLGWLQKGDASLNELAQSAQGLGASITGSAIHERMGATAIELLGRVLMGALGRLCHAPRLPIGHLECFRGVYVTDSTQIGLPPTLLDRFRGTNGNAMVKLQVTIDYLTGQWVALEMEAGKSPDQNSDLPLKQAVAGSLNLFDLGYFKQERLRDIDAQAAYFVSRYQAQTAVYDPENGERIDLVNWLQTLDSPLTERIVELGFRVHLPVRLVVRRLSPQAAAARRRKAKKQAREQGKTCTKAYLYLLGWDILITNLLSDDWTPAQIFDLYPIRIQIEWLFRIWKSQLKVDHFGSWRMERVLCQLYAHLIGALLCQRLSAGWHWREGVDYSLFKCVQIIQDHVKELMRCIAHNWRGLRTWRRNLEAAFHMFGTKTKRKKDPSTYQILMIGGLS
jgi:hypothetical protein